MAKIGRNSPCPCGSGFKYKKCCGAANASGAISPAVAAAFEQKRLAWMIKHGREPKLGDGMLKEELPPPILPEIPTLEITSKKPEDEDGGRSDEG